MVTQNWQAVGIATTPTQLHTKLMTIQNSTKEWARNRITTIKRHLGTCRDYLGWLNLVKERRQTTPLERFIAAKIKKRFMELSVLEEDIWRQRAHTKWELQGDRGTRFFHTMASVAKKANTIVQIEHQGITCSDQRTKAQTFFQFYVNLIGQQSSEVPHIHWEILYDNQRDHRDLHILEKEITLQEVIETIKQWPKNKSPGPDGFSGEFYIQFVEVLAPNLCRVFQHVTTHGISLEPLNSSYIVLLPKKEASATVQDYRPISLLHGV